MGKLVSHNLIATLLAISAVCLEAWRPYSASDSACALLAFFSLLFSLLLLLRQPSGGAMLASFLPAIPLAAAVLALDDTNAGVSALAATGLALQLRCLLLALASKNQAKREQLAKKLMDRLPKKATVFVDNDIESEVSISSLRDGHLFRLAPGQVIPADGIVTFGSGFVNETLIPGESVCLKVKGMGSYVYAGTHNHNATLLVRATTVGNDTFLAKLALRILHGTETATFRLLAIDGVLTLGAVLLFLPLGPTAALQVFLLASGASILAALARFEYGLARMSIAKNWLWRPGGLKRIARTGMFVFRPEGVISEGRPKLVAVESESLSEDSVLGMLGPIARKLETPPAFALLQELRQRNIPLQPVEFYQQLENGAIAIVAGDELRWVSLQPSSFDESFGVLDPFIQEHLIFGEEIILLERKGRFEAALAFRDRLLSGVLESVEEFQSHELPLLLVSTFSKRSVSRLQTELGLKHAQGEMIDTKIESLMRQLSEEELAPAWIQTSDFHPQSVSAIASLPQTKNHGADLTALELPLPAILHSFDFARRSIGRLRLLQVWIFGSQLGFLICLMSWANTFALASLAIAGALPGFLALLLASPQPSTDSV